MLTRCSSSNYSRNSISISISNRNSSSSNIIDSSVIKVQHAYTSYFVTTVKIIKHKHEQTDRKEGREAGREAGRKAGV